jgi:DNA repair protein RadA/Sms
MTKARTVFVCQNCGNESPKWLGRCPECNQWNSYIERVLSPVSAAKPKPIAQELSRVSIEGVSRLILPFSEFNRVLGGGIVPGSLVLIGGDPGIGKSTLLLQVAGMVAQEGGEVLYVSGEESVPQIRLRAERLGLAGDRLYLLPETALENILEYGQELLPQLMVIDSVQTVYVEGLASAAGSVGQLRECTLRLMQWAKSSGVPVLLVGHVTKDGTIAGPHVLEHIVDVVLYLEGERFSSFRLLRGVKNRFGSTNEVGVFEMRDRGLVEVDNPSQAFLSQRAESAIGSVIVPTLEGTRPLLVEIQALTSPSSFGLPRRTANGVDFNRLVLIAAVLNRRAGVPLSNQDIIVNVAGGIRISEPAADLGIALAIGSSFRGRRAKPNMVAIGEVGLSGELRAVSQLDRRLAEAAKLGFDACLLPATAQTGLPSLPIEPVAVSSLSQALKVALA